VLPTTGEFDAAVKRMRRGWPYRDQVDQLRGEFGDRGGAERNPWEHPEQSYRRGFQQGAHEIVDTLRKAGVLDPAVESALHKFTYCTVADWRFTRRRRLRRHITKDRAPRLIPLSTEET
jgi:hypothetical protein